MLKWYICQRNPNTPALKYQFNNFFICTVTVGYILNLSYFTDTPINFLLLRKHKPMLKYSFLFLVGLFSIIACKQPAIPTEVDADNNQYFGAKITADEAMPFKELLLKISDTDSLQTKVIGTVESVCQVKGCWMNIVMPDTGEEMFVKFKDYGFFMPKDISGQQVVMDGVAYREITSLEELRHYAEDEGKSAEEIAEITGPAEELKFMASGVVLLAEK